MSSAPTHVAYFPENRVDRVELTIETFDEKLQELRARNPRCTGVPTVEALPSTPLEKFTLPESAVQAIATGSTEDRSSVAEPAPSYSAFGGSLVTDGGAKARIEAQHAALAASGVSVDASQQLYATGTRMAEVGYATQRARKVEHDKLAPFAEVAERLAEQVRAEQRDDVEVSAADFARNLKANGKLSAFGLRLQEQAVRGLFARVDSPALGYVLGVRDRIAERVRAVAPEASEAAKHAVGALNHEDMAKIADVIAHECRLSPDARLKLRTRKAEGDIFAIVSPRYAPADAPEVLARIARGLPEDARGTYSYDPATTTWEVRADVWTPTPVDEQAVGEAFRGYVSFRSRDNGTGRLNGGGGIELLRCLNASTYVAQGESLQRNHVGRILLDVAKMRERAQAAIHALCKAWGVARERVVEVPAEAPVGPVSKVLEGFWFGELYSPKSELARVLPGRTKDHVAGLVQAQLSERRDPERLVRADFAQGWTRYVQGQPADVRRDAEAAIASWVVADRPMTFDLDRSVRG